MCESPVLKSRVFQNRMDLYSSQVKIPESANCKLLLTMGMWHYEPGKLNCYWYRSPTIILFAFVTFIENG